MVIEVARSTPVAEIDEPRSARVVDGSGGIAIEQVREDVWMEDGSGEIDVRDVNGSLTLEDDSGSIRAHAVTGTVHVRRDGSAASG